MPQTNQFQEKPPEQQIQVKEKTGIMPKVVLGVGMLCAFLTLINFTMLFNAGVMGLNEQFIRERKNQVRIAISDKSGRVDNIESTNPMSVRVAAVRYHQTYGYTLAQNIEVLTDKIQAILNDHGDEVDVIVTPEYTLTNLLPPGLYYQVAVDFSCDDNFNNCTMSSAGGVNSETVINTINVFKEMAIQNHFYLFLGTVAERVYTAGMPNIPYDYVYFNAMVIIDPQGSIAIKRKTGSDWNPSPPNGSPQWQAIYDLSLDTVRSFTIYNRNNEPLTAFVTICGEYGDQELIQYALSHNIQDIDLLIHSETQGDVGYQTITEAIQSGTWNPNLAGWNWAMAGQYGFINLYVNTGILRPNAYLLVADGTGLLWSAAGIINLQESPAPVTEYELTADYMYGLIQYCSDGTIEGQCSATKPQSCSQRNLINNCSQCGCPAGQECLPDESCRPIPVIKFPYNGNINGN